MKKAILIIMIAVFGSMANGQSSSSNIAVSVKTNNNQYSYKARFDKNKTDDAKATIVKTLGEPLEETSRNLIWKGKGYSVSLRNGKVEMNMDKDETTKSFQLKFEALGEQVSESIGSPKLPKPPTPPTPPFPPSPPKVE